jgi:hypothetical protein
LDLEALGRILAGGIVAELLPDLVRIGIWYLDGLSLLDHNVKRERKAAVAALLLVLA